MLMIFFCNLLFLNAWNHAHRSAHQENIYACVYSAGRRLEGSFFFSMPKLINFPTQKTQGQILSHRRDGPALM